MQQNKLTESDLKKFTTIVLKKAVLDSSYNETKVLPQDCIFIIDKLEHTLNRKILKGFWYNLFHSLKSWDNLINDISDSGVQFIKAVISNNATQIPVSNTIGWNSAKKAEMVARL